MDEAERAARSAPSAWRITFQARIADRPGTPPGRDGCSGGPVQALRPIRLRRGRWGSISAIAACHEITQPGDAVQQAFVLQQAHHPSAGLPGMAMLAAQPGDARRGRARGSGPGWRSSRGSSRRYAHRRAGPAGLCAASSWQPRSDHVVVDHDRQFTGAVFPCLVLMGTRGPGPGCQLRAPQVRRANPACGYPPQLAHCVVSCCGETPKMAASRLTSVPVNPRCRPPRCPSAAYTVVN